jgi:large subunit ribosomal protein L21
MRGLFRRIARLANSLSRVGTKLGFCADRNRPYPAQILMELFMYAVIKSGGKQHRVVQGETLKVELLKHEVGQTFSFDDVLMVVDGDTIKIGTPVVAGAKVQAEVISHGRHDKIRIVKFRRRKHYRKQAGHRQYYTELKITGISL